MSEADRKMASTVKTGFDTLGYTLGNSDMNFDTQLAMAISASLSEGKHVCLTFQSKHNTPLCSNFHFIKPFNLLTRFMEFVFTYLTASFNLVTV